MIIINRHVLPSVLGALGALFVLGAPASAQKPPDFVPGRILVQFQPEATAEQVRNAIAAANAQDTKELPHIGVHILKLPAGANETAIARAFAQRPEVVFAELDLIHKPEGTPNDPSYGTEWHLPKIGCPTAWNTTAGNSSVIIAIIDTGVDSTHPDLAPHIVPGWNVYDNNNNTADVYGHGTAVAGAAAACGNNGIGVAGVAWNCAIMPIRSSNSYGASLESDEAAGILWAADHGARVANVSARISDSLTCRSAAQYMMGKGGVVTCSAGNSTAFESNPDDPYIINCSATDSTDTIASYSNYGNNIDVAAPGSSIRTTNRGGGYGTWSGTSFSAPVTAGVAALVIAANPSLTGAQVSDIVLKSADDLGTAGWDMQYGWGRVNAARAVQMALNTSAAPDSTPPTVAIESPGNSATVGGNFNVLVDGTDNMGVSSVTLYLDGVQVASAPGAPSTFPWNTYAVSNGAHSLRAVVMDTSGNTAGTEISVTVYNAPDTTAPTISITSPTGGKLGNSLSIATSVSDDRGVVKVELWVDGKLFSNDTSAPWSFSANTRKWTTGSHTLQCKAYDAAGNVGLSQTVTVTK